MAPRWIRGSDKCPNCNADSDGIGQSGVWLRRVCHSCGLEWSVNWHTNELSEDTVRSLNFLLEHEGASQ